MLSERALVIAVAVAVVLWVALDSGWLRSEPALPGTSAALEALAALFAVSAWVMHTPG
jgi:hypothetical protein